MSCPIHWHDRCACYNASLQYTTSISTTTASSQFGPQAGNIFVGYELATPLVATSRAWHPVESVIIQPPASYSGQELSQPDHYRLPNTYETLPLQNGYRREPHVHEQEQKPAPLSREQFATRHSYPTPYIQGVTRVAMPNSYSESLVPLLRAHRNSTSGFANYDLVSPIESVISNSDLSTMFDEPPPPYPNNALFVNNPPSDVFSSSAESLLNIGPITPSPLAPVPLRHSSLYQVLKHDTPTSPAQGTLQSRASSIAHALEPREPQARQAPVLRDRQNSTISVPELLLSTDQAASTSLAVVAVDPSPTLPQLPALGLAPAVQPRSPVSSTTPPCVVLPQDVSVVMPLEAHTLADPLPEVTTHDYDTLPRLRKLQPAMLGSAKEDQSTVSSPLSPVSSRPSSSSGAPAVSISDTKGGLESAFTLPLLGRKRPVLRAKLACLFCRRRKIQCRPLPGDHPENSCQQCAKRSRKCEYPEMTWRGRGRKRPRTDLDESEYEEDSLPQTKKTRREATL